MRSYGRTTATATHEHPARPRQRRSLEVVGNVLNADPRELEAAADPWYQPRNAASTVGLSTFAVKRTGAQAIPTTAGTRVVLNTVTRSYDPGNSMSLNAANGIITVTQAGTYMTTGFIAFDLADTTGDRVAFVTTTMGEVAREFIPGGYANLSVTAVANMNSGDTIQLGAYQTSAGTLNLNSALFTSCRQGFLSTISSAWR